MAQVVELFGAPGTGKSSLVAALDGVKVAGRTLIDARRLTRVARVTRGVAWRRGHVTGRAQGSLVGVASGGPLGRVQAALGRALTPEERRAALARRRGDWAALLEIVGSSPLGRDGDDPLRTLYGPGWLATSLELRALADEASGDIVVLLDEGLVQRTSLVCGYSPDDVTLHRFLDRIPPAALQVHLSAVTGAILPRLHERDRVIDRHVGLGDDALTASVVADGALFARAAAHLASRAHPVLRLDSAVTSLDGLVDEVAAALARQPGLPVDRQVDRGVGTSGSEPTG